MAEYEMMFAPGDFYSASVTIKSHLSKRIKKIKEKLSESQLKLFNQSCFGHFLEVNELNFSGSLVTQMLWRQCRGDDMDVMEFAFGTSVARYTIHDFMLITGLRCVPKPQSTYSSPHSIHAAYFRGSSIVKNGDIIRAFEDVICTDDQDMVKLAMIYFLELVVLSKQDTTHTDLTHIYMVDDFEYFNSYPWGSLSYVYSLESMRGAPGKRVNNSHTYTLVGFPLAFMLWGIESVPALSPMFGFRDKLIRYPRLLNWTIIASQRNTRINDILSDDQCEVVHLVPTDEERPFVDAINWCDGHATYDAPPHVKRVLNEKKRKRTDKERNQSRRRSPLRHAPCESSPFAPPLNEGTPAARPPPPSVDIDHRLARLEDILGDLKDESGFMKDRMMHIENKVDLIIELLSSQPRRTFEEKEPIHDHFSDYDKGIMDRTVSDISDGAWDNTTDDVSEGQRDHTDHYEDHDVGEGRVAHDACEEREYHHVVDCGVVNTGEKAKLLGTDALFQPFQEVSNDVALKYLNYYFHVKSNSKINLHFVEVNKSFFKGICTLQEWIEDVHVWEITHLMRKRALLYPNIFSTRTLVLDNRFSDLLGGRYDWWIGASKQAKIDYKWDTDVTEWIAGTSANMIGIGPWAQYDRVLLPLYRDRHWMLGEINLRDRHMTLYDSRRHDGTPKYQVIYFDVYMDMLPYVLRETQFFGQRTDITSTLERWKVSLCETSPKQCNDDDCGVFMLKTIELLWANFPLAFAQDDILRFRKRYAAELYAREMLL